MAEKIDEDDWIETYTGKRFYFIKPTVDMVDILDVAHALGNICRYNGQCQRRLCVGEHACHLHDYYLYNMIKTPSPTLSDILMLKCILHHDDSEAYLCDMTRPVKAILPDFKNVEMKTDKIICEKFGLPYPHPPLVKELDSRIIKDERAQNMFKTSNKWQCDTLESLGVVLKYWGPRRAEAEFLLRHRALEDRTVTTKKRGFWHDIQMTSIYGLKDALL